MRTETKEMIAEQMNMEKIQRSPMMEKGGVLRGVLRGVLPVATRVGARCSIFL